MRGRHWDPEYEVPWDKVKLAWDSAWDDDKPFRLEKSPPNILRARQMEEHFRPSSFLAMIGNPYAFCEGCWRRNNSHDLPSSARFWLQCARQQRRNVEELDDVLLFTYEDLTENTSQILDRIRQFVPLPGDFDTSISGGFSVLGRGETKIRNLNAVKLKRLSHRSYTRINSVLEGNEELLHYFGYEIEKPGPQQTLTALRVRTSTHAVRAVRWMEQRGILPTWVLRSTERLLVT